MMYSKYPHHFSVIRTLNNHYPEKKYYQEYKESEKLRFNCTCTYYVITLYVMRLLTFQSSINKNGLQQL